MNEIPLAARIAAPLAVSALLAAGCSSSTTPSASTGGGATTAGAPTSAAATGGGAASASITVDEHTGPDGTYLTDGSGRTLYLFLADTSGSSMCSNSPCVSVWPPLTTTSTAAAGSGVTATDVSTITRSDGTKQVTYGGHPLYYFAHDASAGQTNGQGIDGFGARWWIVSPSGAAITTIGGSGGTSTPAPSGSSTKSGGSGWA